MEDSHVAANLVSSIVTLLLTALFIHFGAGYIVNRRNFVQAIIVALLGSLLAGLVLAGLGFGTVAVLVALAAWALVAGIVYRTSWLGGVGIGIMAWLLWWLVTWLIRLVF